MIDKSPTMDAEDALRADVRGVLAEIDGMISREESWAEECPRSAARQVSRALIKARALVARLVEGK